MYTFIIILITFIALLLTLAVLLQSGQGQGLSGGIAGNMAANSVLGARRTSDFLSKSTTYLGTAFLVLCLASNFFIERQSTGGSIITGSSVNAPAPISSPSAIPTETSGN
jgi:preprotein translocase subunit SecG